MMTVFKYFCLSWRPLQNIIFPFRTVPCITLLGSDVSTSLFKFTIADMGDASTDIFPNSSFLIQYIQITTHYLPPVLDLEGMKCRLHVLWGLSMAEVLNVNLPLLFRGIGDLHYTLTAEVTFVFRNYARPRTALRTWSSQRLTCTY